MPTVRPGAENLALTGCFFAVFAVAQPAQSQTVTVWPPRWTVAAGVESLWWEDVARTGPPVDGSPVSWEGRGRSCTSRTTAVDVRGCTTLKGRSPLREASSCARPSRRQLPLATTGRRG